MSVTTLLKVGVRSDMTRLRDAYVRSAHLVLQRSMARPRKGVLRAVPVLVCERRGALEGLLLAVGQRGTWLPRLFCGEGSRTGANSTAIGSDVFSQTTANH